MATLCTKMTVVSFENVCFSFKYSCKEKALTTYLIDF